MKNYEKMWFELKKELLTPPSLINKETLLKTMTRIEIDEVNEIPARRLFEPLATFTACEDEVKEDEPKGLRKFFKR